MAALLTPQNNLRSTIVSPLKRLRHQQYTNSNADIPAGRFIAPTTRSLGCSAGVFR